MLWKTVPVVFLTILSMLTDATDASADTLTLGNFVVANAATITEYTPAGDVVQQFVIPSPLPGFDVYAKGVAVDEQGRVHVLIRTGMFGFETYLSTLEPRTNAWVHHTTPTWTLAGVGYYGGIGVDFNYVFAPDQETANDPTDGVLRFTLADLSSVDRFQEEPFGDVRWHDTSIGLNGDLYALARSGTLRRIDPESMATIVEMNVSRGQSVMGVAVAGDGEIFAIDIVNDLHRFDSAGNWIETVDVPGGNTDLDLADDGTLLVSSFGDTLTVINTSDLTNQFVIDTSAQAMQFELNFATIVKTTPFIKVDALAANVTRGILAGGSYTDLVVSDNIDMTAFRNPTDVSAVVTFEISTTAPIVDPSGLTFSIESGVFARSQVNQTVELFNYQANQFELVDMRLAERTGDAAISISPPGDLSRFVDPTTADMRARVKYESTVARQQFSVGIDRVGWRIED